MFKIYLQFRNWPTYRGHRISCLLMAWPSWLTVGSWQAQSWQWMQLLKVLDDLSTSH